MYSNRSVDFACFTNRRQMDFDLMFGKNRRIVYLVQVLGVLYKYLCREPFSFKAFYFFTASIIKALRC